MFRSSCPDRRTGTLQGGPRGHAALPSAVAAVQFIAQFSTHILMSEQALCLSPVKLQQMNQSNPHSCEGQNFLVLLTHHT